MIDTEKEELVDNIEEIKKQAEIFKNEGAREKIFAEIKKTEKSFRDSMTIFAEETSRLREKIKGALSQGEKVRLDSIIDRATALANNPLKSDANPNEDKSNAEILSVMSNSAVFEKLRHAVLSQTDDMAFLGQLEKSKDTTISKAYSTMEQSIKTRTNLTVQSVAIMPVQRGGRYELFAKDLLRNTAQAETSRTETEQTVTQTMMENIKTNNALKIATDQLLKLAKPLLAQLNVKAGSTSFFSSKNGREAAQHLHARLTEAINDPKAGLESIQALVNMAMKDGVFSSEKNKRGEYKSTTFNELAKLNKMIVVEPVFSQLDRIIFKLRPSDAEIKEDEQMQKLAGEVDELKNRLTASLNNAINDPSKGTEEIKATVAMILKTDVFSSQNIDGNVMIDELENLEKMIGQKTPQSHAMVISDPISYSVSPSPSSSPSSRSSSLPRNNSISQQGGTSTTQKNSEESYISEQSRRGPGGH